MLIIALGLVLISAACAVVLMEASQTVLPVVGRGIPVPDSAAPTTDWRGAALNAHTDSANLQFAIVAALETDDLGHRDTILRSALRETGSRVPVNVAL
ncbi:hypothetical protein ABIE44_001614 [Marmoricola sp. OAE513]|uniref:hypothetical protein n=1 Tax=Marmoricola sp. OAE513 TaxID=2817894 RepID=UPI001AE62BDC